MVRYLALAAGARRHTPDVGVSHAFPADLKVKECHTQQAENIGCIPSSASVTLNKESRESGDPGENVESYCFRMITLKNNRSINKRSAKEMKGTGRTA